MGDVLAGIVGALIAQGADAGAALRAGVHLHGLAADRLVASGVGPVGMTASEVAHAARDVFNGLRSTCREPAKPGAAHVDRSASAGRGA
jgi:NAD(P)H-hydrate repair Nnr-like enzyme with NAD(P)H-hydrate dehydratase domain